LRLHTAARVEDVPAGKMVATEIESEKILLANVAGSDFDRVRGG